MCSLTILYRIRDTEQVSRRLNRPKTLLPHAPISHPCVPLLRPLCTNRGKENTFYSKRTHSTHPVSHSCVRSIQTGGKRTHSIVREHILHTYIPVSHSSVRSIQTGRNKGGGGDDKACAHWHRLSLSLPLSLSLSLSHAHARARAHTHTHTQSLSLRSEAPASQR